MVRLARRRIVPDDGESHKVLDSDPKRTSIGFSNQHTGAVFFDAEQAVNEDTGFPLESNGGNGSLTDFFGDDPRLPVYMIVKAGTGDADVRIITGKSFILALLRDALEIITLQRLRGG